MSQETTDTRFARPAVRPLGWFALAAILLGVVLEVSAAEIVAPVTQPKRAGGAVRKESGGPGLPADATEAPGVKPDAAGRAGAKSRRVIDKSKRVGEPDRSDRSDRPDGAARPSNHSGRPEAATAEPVSEKSSAHSRRAAAIEAANIKIKEADARRAAAEIGVREAEERLEKAQAALRVAESKKADTRARKTTVALAKIDLRRAEVEYEYRRDELTHLAREVDELRASVTALRFEDEVARYGHPVRTIKDVRPEDVLREVRAAGYGAPREIIYDGANNYRVEGFDDQGKRFILRYDTATGQFERVK